MKADGDEYACLSYKILKALARLRIRIFDFDEAQEAIEKVIAEHESRDLVNEKK